MEVKFIYKIFPVIVIYSRIFMKKWMAGVSYGPIVFISPEYRNKNTIILEHELIHSRQVLRTLGMQSILYTFSAKYRMKYELEAYITMFNDYEILQKCLNGPANECIVIDGFANRRNKRIVNLIISILYKNYNLKMTKEEIRKATYSYYRILPVEKNQKVF